MDCPSRRAESNRFKRHCKDLTVVALLVWCSINPSITNVLEWIKKQVARFYELLSS
ncbi:hypothetical protein P692DRAFT_20834307 [Suillus brevipes Sb2]|nr:hypothetical protein P692DRAFT_20834307 [Suillus brevipes Sb2]